MRMHHPSLPLPSLSPAPTIADLVQEEHLRLAVLVDLIEDELALHLAVAPRLAQLRMEYDRHALRQEQVLAQHAPTLLSLHRRGHDRMRALLGRLSAEHDSGADIHTTLDEVVALFTDQLIPEDSVFQTMTLSAAP